MEVKILQWNIWYKEKPENIIAALKEFDADILCLQELTQTSEFNPGLDIPAFIANELGLFSAFHIAQTWEKSGATTRNQGNGIFSKYPIRSHIRKAVQASRDNNPDFDDEERIYIEAEIDVNDSPLTVGTTHLSYTHGFTSSEKRDAENGKLLEYIGRNRKHYFFSGDLNAPSGSEIIDTLPRRTDLQIASPPYDQNTWTTKPFSYQGFEVDILSYRLDYAFCSNDLEVIDAKILQTDVSDHLPILTIIRI